MANTHDILAELVKRVKCKPGWSFRLITMPENACPSLVITVPGYDSAGASSTDAVLQAAHAVVVAHEDGAEHLILESCEKLHEAWDVHRRFTVQHFRPVPEATYNEASWRRWIFEQCLSIENHEMGEWFRDGDERPFQPLHGPGEDPYTVHEFRPVSDALTTQDGSMREPYR